MTRRLGRGRRGAVSIRLARYGATTAGRTMERPAPSTGPGERFSTAGRGAEPLDQAGTRQGRRPRRAELHRGRTGDRRQRSKSWTSTISATTMGLHRPPAGIVGHGGLRRQASRRSASRPRWSEERRPRPARSSSPPTPRRPARGTACQFFSCGPSTGIAPSYFPPKGKKKAFRNSLLLKAFRVEDKGLEPSTS